MLTVSCNICSRQIITVTDPNDAADSTQLYQVTCSCEVDGPVKSYDVDGTFLPGDTSNIVVTES